MMRFNKEKVALLQNLIIESSGETAGIPDFNLLDSALNSCFQTFDGKELYPTKEEKAAILGYSLISNHAFVDGNKRIGLLVMLSFLEINGIKLSMQNQDLIDLGLGIASGQIKYPELLKWIKKHKR